MYKRFVSLFLSFILIFSISVPVNAQALPEEEVILAEIINLADYSADVAKYQAECGAVAKSMGSVAFGNACIVVGSAVFAYLATKGITIAVDKSLEMCATFGRYLISNMAELDPEIQRYVYSTVLNCSVDSDYYETRSNVYTANLLNKLDKYLGNYIDSKAITMNQGLVSQEVISNEVLQEMTTSVYDLYSGMGGSIYCSRTCTVDNPQDAFIWEIPPNISKIELSKYHDKARFYDASGNEITDFVGSLAIHVSDPLGVGFNTGWSTTTYSPPLLNLDPNADYDFGGIHIYENADAVNVNVPLPLDNTNQFPQPLYPTQDLVCPYDAAIDLGTGEKTAEEVAPDIEFVPETDLELDNGINAEGGILNWLKGAWDIFTKILNAILNLPKLCAEAIGNVISALFTPSDADVQNVKDTINLKLPVISDLRTWTNSVANIISNPEGYASSLNFTVDMSKAESRFNYGDSKINLLNLQWYFKYKQQVDEIIIGFAWLVFLWNLYGQLPNIISLVGSGAYLQVHGNYIMNERENRQSKFNKGGD